MDDPTQKFKDKIKEHKNTEEGGEYTEKFRDVVQAASKGLSIIVGLSQLSLVYLSYFLLAPQLGWIYLSIWEFFGIGLGILSLSTFIRNYLKDILGNNTKQTK